VDQGWWVSGVEPFTKEDQMTDREQIDALTQETHALRAQIAALESELRRVSNTHDLEDIRCECCGYMTYHTEHIGCIRAAHEMRKQK
jgi:hypothetical protein